MPIDTQDELRELRQRIAAFNSNSKTQLKICPSWRKYPGFSMIGDPSEIDLTEEQPGVLTMRNVEDTNVLYDKLGKQVFGPWGDALEEELLFARLECSCYHVTMKDGINCENITQLRPDSTKTIQEFFDGLPGSLTKPPSILPRPMFLKTPIRFEFDKLQFWQRSGALVAQIKPADDADSKSALREIERYRRELAHQWQAEHGLPPPSTETHWSPHLTLGYFPANVSIPEDRVSEWSAHFAKEIGDATCTFRSFSCYAFSDMATFRKTKSRTSLVRACRDAQIWNMPENDEGADWHLTPVELEMIEQLVRETPNATLTPKQFFIAWNGVPTLAFEHFGALFDLKLRLNANSNVLRLTEENDGSKWPKVTIGTLNDGRTLTNVEAYRLYQICNEVATNLTPLTIRELNVVAFQCRSLERRYMCHAIALTETDEPMVSSSKFTEHQSGVAKALNNFSPYTILRGLKSPDHRLSRYRQPHAEFTLIAEIGEHEFLRGCIKEFREKVDFWLPGLYTWFSDSSLHLTIRGLMPKSK